MKRSIAMLLVFMLLTAMFPAVSAATAEEQPMMLSKDTSALSIDTAQVMENAVRPYGAWAPSCIMPDFGMYGMTVLKGEPMNVRFDLDKDSDETAVLLIYKGYYEDLNEKSKLVASGQLTSGGGSQSMTWDTTGMSAGDYTIYYTIVDAAGELVYAALTDVFISDKEIPLEKIGFYVMELGMETDTVSMFRQNSMECLTVHPVRYPYHTTDRRHIKLEGVFDSFYTGGGNFYGSDGFYPSGFVGRQYICAYINDDGFRSFLTYLNVDVAELNSTHTKILPEKDVSLTHFCIDAVTPVKIQIPEGYTLEDALVQTSHPGLISVAGEGDTLYVTPLVGWSTMETMIVSFGKTFDAIDFYIREHDYYFKEVVTPATCTEEGLRARTCKYCGVRTEEEVIPALGHDIAQVTTVTEPTATKDGIAVGYCSRCDQDVQLPISRIFTDTQPDRFYSDALDYCYEKGIISGMTATTFGPTGTLNRAQLVSMLYRHAGSPAAEGENTFTDVPAESFYTAAVIWASENGIVYGYEDGSFRPGNSITRQELVAMLHRFVVRLGKDNGERKDLAAFEDLDQLMGYAEDAMQWAVANGVISGISETQLGPRQSANRAQTVTILHRIITGILGE